jgi:hypothetical protein
MVGPLLLMFAVLGILHSRRERMYERYGRTATGRVTELGVDRGDGMTSETYWVDVDFPGECLPIRAQVDKARYDALHHGSSVMLTYIPGRRNSGRTLG